ncbi:MAG: lysophospholipid acyltransferase family protein [Acholeplasmataceae bacterium]|nr:lysophospholipid acyltransferase family protein [Acholeplasmataceae bacterium]
MMTLIFFLSYFGFVLMMGLLIDIPYLIPLWILIGPIIGILMVILFIVINLPIFKVTSYTNRYKFYVAKSTSIFLNHVLLRLNIEITGQENIPKDGLLTIYANHKSYADPFIIYEGMTRAMTFTPKMGVYKIPILHKWLKYLGAFPIDRTSDRNTAKAMGEAIKVVKTGMGMMIFPEGGIKDRDDEKMVAMRAGAYRVAMKAGANLLPVSIIGTTQIKKRAPFRASHIKLIFHPLVTYESVKDKTTAEIAEQMFYIINDKLE